MLNTRPIMTVKRNILRKQQYPVTKWTCENVGREKKTYLLLHLIFLQSFEIQRNSPWDLQNLCWLVFSAPNDKKWSCKIKGKHKILDPFSIKVLSEITLEDQKYTMALLLPEVQNNCRHCTLLMLQQHAYYSPLNHYAMLLKDTRVDSLEWGGGPKNDNMSYLQLPKRLHTNEFGKRITCTQTQIYYFINK